MRVPMELDAGDSRDCDVKPRLVPRRTVGGIAGAAFQGLEGYWVIGGCGVLTLEVAQRQ